MSHPTLVTLTGTGVPHPAPGRAGAGTLVRHGDLELQFDAGRGTTIRLAEAGAGAVSLSALFLTHIHSDHLVDVADVAMTRWVQQQLHVTGPLVIVCAEGRCERFVQRMFDVWDDDIHVRMEHVGADRPGVDLRAFPLPDGPTTVWTSPDGEVTVDAIAVHHEPVEEAVAYRVTTPTGVVVVSGDTRVCDEVGEFARGADVLVHEACRATALAPHVKGTVFETIFSYHADSVALGAMAERVGVPHLVLTHLIPQPTDEAQEAAFERDVRSGGYTGTVTVGRDLTTVTCRP